MWVSHCGRLIRASPQHLRPASLREYSRIPKGSDGLALDETPHGKGFIELDDFPDEVASETRPSPCILLLWQSSQKGNSFRPIILTVKSR